MSAYSDWLIVSDIDGTLNNKKRQLPDVNRVAIKRFVDNGGNFTLCSGRNLQSLHIHYKKLGIKTPAICLNGAGIYDFDTSSALKYTPISSEGEKLILDICKQFKSVQLTVFDMNTVYLYRRTCIYGLAVSVVDGLTRKLCKTADDLPYGCWGKVTIAGLPAVCKKIEAIFKNEENSHIVDCFYTSPISLEVVAKGVNKGSAVSFLANELGVDSANVGAIGDYFNDEAMLKCVSHPACCGQAPEELKKICEYITCHCNDGAVSDFINYIEKNYIE